MSQIGEIARTVGFKGTPTHRIAEPSTVRTLAVVDNTDPTSQANVRTSVDCYVSGTYISRNGKQFEVTQRYTIFVAYSKATQAQTMTQARDRIMGDFQARYGSTFNVSSVYVPPLIVPTGPIPGVQEGAAPAELYMGSRLYKQMTAYEKQRYDVGTERQKSRVNIESIRKRYRGS